MELTVQVTYDRALVRRALRHFMLKRLGLTGITTLLLLTAVLTAVFLSGNWSIYFTSLLVALLIVIGLLLYIYLLRARSSEGFFEKTRDPTVAFTFTEDGVQTTSDLGSSNLKWEAFDELLKFSDAWLLVYARSAYITLPLEQLTEDCRKLIEERF